MTHRDATTDDSPAATGPDRSLGEPRAESIRPVRRSNSLRRDAPVSSGAEPCESIDHLKQQSCDQAHRIADLERDVHALSHAIRSPLVALKGFAGLLDEELSESLSDNGRHFLSRISEAGRRIETRLNDVGQLLAVSETQPAKSWVDPRPLIESLASEFKPALDESGMRILLGPETPPVHCDRRQLEVALTHLIGNCLQHASPCEPRHVEIRIDRDDAETRISVRDGGPGMDESLAQRAFEPFDGAGDRRRRFDDGRESSGIGLTLVRRIAEAHGGRACIDTAPGRGTVVVISFPHE